MREEALRLESVCKTAMGEPVLNNLSIVVHKGSIVSLCGMDSLESEVLSGLLSGADRPDYGRILIGDRLLDAPRTLPAGVSGVHTIHESTTLLPNLTVAENIFLGRETRRIHTASRICAQAREYLEFVGADAPDPAKHASELTLREQTMTELARAAFIRPEVLFFCQGYRFSQDDTLRFLVPILRRMRKLGIAILYVSTDYATAAQFSDAIGMVRRGMCERMIPRSVFQKEHPDRSPTIGGGGEVCIESGEPVLEVRNLTGETFSLNSMILHSGTCLGLHSRSASTLLEFIECMCGIRRIRKGVMRIDGTTVCPKSVRDAIRLGIVFCSPVLGNLYMRNMSLSDNILLPALRRLGRFGIRDRKKEQFYLRHLSRASHLSAEGAPGGGQIGGYAMEKAMLARGLAANPRVLILQEPFLGIDYETEIEIREIIAAVLERGIVVIIVSLNAGWLETMCDCLIELEGERQDDPNVDSGQ